MLMLWQTSLPMEIPGMNSNWLRTLGHAFLRPIYKLDADSRKLRGDLESRGPWSCSIPSAARTLLQGPRLSKTPRSFRESASS